VLIARAPLRISLAGGGTDLEAYYARFGGAVVSATIDKYFYVIVTLSESGHIQVSSSDYHLFFRQRIDDQSHLEGELRLPRAVLAHFGMRTGVSIFLASQVPPGTGLGSSSTVTVALIKAVALLCGERLSASEVAELACEIEIERLGMPIGRQDQYAAAFGGLNFYEFEAGGTRVERLDVPIQAVIGLQDRLMLFFTGVRHDSGQILDDQRRNSSSRDETVDALHAIKALAVRVRDDLLTGDISRVGGYLHESWLAKRTLADGISDPVIDSWYEVARAAGAAGGKIAGAGGGGYLLLYCEPEWQDRVTEELHARGLTRMDFRFEAGGAMVIVNNMVGTLSASRRDAVAHA
jgi:D-glycero-alpha-D-manno-heptose-7-phosphate kinase